MNSTLPHRDKDAILTLYAHYFLAGELMFKNYKKLSMPENLLSQDNLVELEIYFCTWLGFLAVTAEGFKKLRIRILIGDSRPPRFVKLIPRADELGSLLKKHDDALRKFRNNVFHLRENTEEIEQFFYERPNRLEWAETLQSEFGQFFQTIGFSVRFIMQSKVEKRSFSSGHPIP